MSKNVKTFIVFLISFAAWFGLAVITKGFGALPTSSHFIIMIRILSLPTIISIIYYVNAVHSENTYDESTGSAIRSMGLLNFIKMYLGIIKMEELTESEAIMILCGNMNIENWKELSKSDLEDHFSTLFKHDGLIMNNPVYCKHLDKYDSDLFDLKKEWNDWDYQDTLDAAINTLKAKPLSTQLDALSIVWHTLIEDGKIGKGEDQFMTKLLVEFDINIASVKANLKIQRMM